MSPSTNTFNFLSPAQSSSTAFMNYADSVDKLGCHATIGLILMNHDLVPFSTSASSMLDHGAGIGISTHTVI